MIFSYNWLQDYIKTKLPKPDKLAEVLTQQFTEVEGVKKSGNDFVLDIDVKPNRAGDCFSHLGIARECSAILGLKFKLPSFALKQDEKLNSKDFIEIQVQDKNACPRYAARVMTDVKVGSSPKWIQQRLKACGLQSINNIVDIVNYVMLETGQPLHAFDARKLKGNKIIVRFARKGEKITTLDEQKFILDKNVLVIADEKTAVAIAGIKGGKGPSIDKNTKTIVLESANFNSKIISRGSKILNLKTDASWRFEHGIDPNLAEIAINRTANLIQEIAGGKIAKGLIDFYPNKVKSKKILLKIDNVTKLLGVKIPEKTIIKILKSLEFNLSEIRSQSMLVEVPTFRLDVSAPEDLIEEIGRIYDYTKIPVILPKISLIPPEVNLRVFWEELAKDILKQSGFAETYNYCFINEKNKQLFGYKKQELLEIENPVSVEYQYLSPSLIPNLLEGVKNNFRYFNEIKTFEFGKIFSAKQAPKEALQAIETRSLVGLIAKKNNDETLFYELKGMVDTLLEKMGIAQVWYDEYEATPEQSKISVWNASKCAEIKIDSQEIGFLGEISSEILEALKIKGKVVLFDIDFEKLQKLCSEEHEFRPISPYPEAIRDLAILVPRNTKIAQVLNIISEKGNGLVRDVDLFDIYEGEELPQNKKNLAFHIIYQAEDRTLKAEEIDKVHKKIIKALEQNLEWEARK